MKTIEQGWQDFRSQVYPGTPETTEQMRQLKSCWFSAHFNLLNELSELGAEAETDEEGAVQMENLYAEANLFIKKFISEEYKRQGKNER